jgi:ABC-type nitrate/sulfonate/bicarbonate transport system substrate-binding protein
MIRENPDLVQRMVRAMAETIHYYKNNKESVVKIMQKYSRGPSRTFFEEVYDVNVGVLVEDTYPTIEGLKNTLEIQASIDPKAAKAKAEAEDFVDLRFVDELKKSGFIEKLYGKR